MDILTCSVGVMITVVLVAVLDARGSAVTVALPLAQNPPKGAERLVVLCANGRVRPFDVGDAFRHLVEDKKVTYENIPRLVKRANEVPYTDGYFTYRFEMRQWSDGDTYRAVDMTVQERPEAPGFDLEQLRHDPAPFLAALDGLASGRRIWVGFLVDKSSIEVFREARTLVLKRGLRVGWDPATLKFPHRETVLGGGSVPTGPTILDKINY